MSKESFRDYDWVNVITANSGKDTAEENFEKFYYPVFERTKYYRRIAGYFSSSSLSYLCEGITELIENDGTMFLITSSEITEKDKEAMENSTISRDELLSRSWNDLLVESEENIELKDCFEALSWLLANGRLVIKIGFNLREGRILSNQESKFHEKVALYEDAYGDFIVSIGSGNETGPGYRDNREFMAIQESWRDPDLADDCLLEFNTLWSDTDPNSKVYTLPATLEQKLLAIAPKEDKLYFRRKKQNKKCSKKEKEVTSKETEERELFDYQEAAIKEWVDSGYCCVFNMATGTGKTFTALNAVKLQCNTESGIVLIVAPQIEIAKQWEKECRTIFGEETSILMCNGHNKKWRQLIGDVLQTSLIEFQVIITVNNTFSRDYFFDCIAPYLRRIVLIADEMHEIGAPKSREKLELLDKIPRRLGLSATPKRMRDAEGNSVLESYFGGRIYEYSMHKAIQNEKLCKYNYYMHYSTLDSDELEKYHALTKEISRYYTPNQDVPSARLKKYDYLCRERAKIIKGSRDRISMLKSILLEYDPTLNPEIKNTYSKCIIYCNTVNESKIIYKMVRELGLSAIEYHSNIKSREMALYAFDKTDFTRYVISIGCLDQGVDVPSCDGAIILSSSSNERQYIQRRGRVLRTNGGKKQIAYIHDILVLPCDYEDLVRDRVYLDDIEQNMVYKQLTRAGTFIDDSENACENEDRLLELKRVL